MEGGVRGPWCWKGASCPTGDHEVILRDHEAGETLIGDEQVKLKLEVRTAP